MPKLIKPLAEETPESARYTCAAILCFACFSFFFPAAAGLCFGGHSLVSLFKPLDFLILTLALYALSSFSLTRWLIAVPFIAAAACYLPAGVLYGKPNMLIGIALLQTTPSETGEFLANTPWRIFLEAAGLMLAGFAGVWCASRAQAGKLVPLIAAAAVIASGAVTMLGKKDDPLSVFQCTEFSRSAALTGWNSYTELKEEAGAPAPDWKIGSVQPKFRNYVIVIGESMRRDYASVYGYPLDTTPFLGKAKGTFFTNFEAPGGNTGISLPRLLSLNYEGDRFSRANNVLTLANAAGYETWWISNQGRGGAFDNPIAQIGVRAQHTVWLKGNYADPNVDDDKLLPKLEEALKTPGDKPRLFVLHLMGSHPTFCVRLSGRPAAYEIGDSSMACYLTTYRTLDNFLKEAVDRLNGTGESWSLVYFSDHGLNMVKKPGTQSGQELEHGYDHRQNYDVPFFELSSASRAHEKNPAKRSGYRLLQGFADWLGIESPTLPKTGDPAFWSRENDRCVMVFGKKKYDELASDPAVVYKPEPPKESGKAEEKK